MFFLTLSTTDSIIYSWVKDQIGEMTTYSNFLCLLSIAFLNIVVLGDTVCFHNNFITSIYFRYY